MFSEWQTILKLDHILVSFIATTMSKIGQSFDVYYVQAPSKAQNLASFIPHSDAVREMRQLIVLLLLITKCRLRRSRKLVQSSTAVCEGVNSEESNKIGS